jgi:hypothetical protein
VRGPFVEENKDLKAKNKKLKTKNKELSEYKQRMDEAVENVRIKDPELYERARKGTRKK